MSRKFTLLVDVDEVLADFVNPVFDIIEKVTNTRMTSSDFDVWDIFEHKSLIGSKDTVFSHIEEPGWVGSLKPLPGAQDAIEGLRSMGVEVYALTSPHHSRNWYFERVEWLKQHYDLPKKQIIQTAAKYMVRGDAFLDDNPEHIEKWKAEHPDKLAMLWHIVNTSTLGFEDVRVRNWGEVKDRISARMGK